jgi:hypothetical protein
MLARPAQRLAACLSAAVLGGALLGCAAESRSPSEAAEPDSGTSQGSGRPGAPDCSEIWVDGGEIPVKYAGCNATDGSFVRADLLNCSSGQRMVRFDDRFYGVQGGLVHESESVLEDDVGYRDAVASCRA